MIINYYTSVTVCDIRDVRKPSQTQRDGSKRTARATESTTHQILCASIRTESRMIYSAYHKITRKLKARGIIKIDSGNNDLYFLCLETP